MLVAGLRFNPDKNSAGGTHLEAKSGSYIYYGDAASFHDWEFRTRLRIRLWKEGNKTKVSSRKSTLSATPKKGDMPNGGTEEDAELPGFPPVEPEDEEEEEVIITKPDISTLVNKILEVSRGDAFLLTRDVGLDALTSQEGLEDLLQKRKAFVFPRANDEEAKELVRAGQKHGGPLSRQAGESMLSYTMDASVGGPCCRNWIRP